MIEERLYLYIEEGFDDVKKYFLLPENGVAVIGRDTRCELHFDDTRISRRHCQLVVSTAKRLVETTDLGSSNGILVNFKKTQQAILRPGDTLHIGRLIFRLRALDEPPEEYESYFKKIDRRITTIKDTTPTRAVQNINREDTDFNRFADFIKEYERTVDTEESRVKHQFSTEEINAFEDQRIIEEEEKDINNISKLRKTDLMPRSELQSDLDQMIGQTLGNYKLVELTDVTMFWRDYKAKHTILNKSYVVRVMSSEYTDTPEFKQRFQREARVGSRLFHPNIIRLASAGKEDDYYFFAREYQETIRVDFFVANTGPLQPKFVVDMGKQIASALYYAHQNQILHRNLNPTNILIDKKGTVLISDFGFSALLDQPSTGSTLAHAVDPRTILYRSPELMSESPEASERSDIYSLCAILYFALSGRSPFLKLPDVFEGVSQPIASLVPDISPMLAEIIHKGLERDPDERFVEAHEIATAFENIMM